MKAIMRFILASAILMVVAYTGTPGSSSDDRCLWPTNPNNPECARNELPSQPT
jgi:hypothetical protein